jgi:hypothetical protein
VPLRDKFQTGRRYRFPDGDRPLRQHDPHTDELVELARVKGDRSLDLAALLDEVNNALLDNLSGNACLREIG